MSSPCPYVPPPAGAVAWGTQPVSAALLAWATSNLHYPMGTIVQAEVGGQPVIARLECHYHPPGGTIKSWGPHKGCTIYWPTAPITPGVTAPLFATEDPAPGITDPCLLAGGEYYGCTEERSTDWPLVIVSATAILATAAAFVLAIKLAGRPRLS